MYETDASSLCTLCVLENEANAFENFSSSLSLDDTQIFSSFDIEKKFPAALLPEINNVTAGINYLSSHRESFDKTEENVNEENKKIDSVKSQHEKDEKWQWKLRIPADDNNGSQCRGISIERKKSLQQSTIPSFPGMSQTISCEIGILPELSQTIIDRVLSVVDQNLIESSKNVGIPSKFDESSKNQPQASMSKTSSQTVGKAGNREKMVSKVQNPLLEPIQRLEWLGPLGMALKRDKNNGPTDTAPEVPKKKPKIVAQEVLNLPAFRLPRNQQDFAASVQIKSKENMNNDDSRVGTKVFREKRLQTPMDTEESEERMVRPGNELENREPRVKERNVKKEKNAERKSDGGKENAKNFVNPSESDSRWLKKRFPPSYSDLSMLQRKITENSQSLVKQAEDMKRLRYQFSRNF